MTQGSPEEGINMPEMPNLEDMPEGDTTNLALDEALDIEFNIPDEDECKNIITNPLNPLDSFCLNKYQQLNLLYRYVKRCDKFRNGDDDLQNKLK